MTSPDGRPLAIPKVPWLPDPCPRCGRRVDRDEAGYKCRFCEWRSVSRPDNCECDK